MYHVHVTHILCQLIDGNLSVNRGNTVAVVRPLELFAPFLPESPALLRLGAGHGDDGGGRSVIEEKPLLEFSGIFVNLDLVSQGLRNPQATAVRVKGVEVFHAENVIHRDLPNQTARCPDLIEGVADVRSFLHPVRRERPQLDRATQGVKLIQKITLAFQLQVNLQEPPAGRRGHFVKRVGMGHKVQKWVL